MVFGRALHLARREALWAIKGLRDEPLPLFAAAAAREADEAAIAEQAEPAMALRPMTGGREVVEDYGHIGLEPAGASCQLPARRISPPANSLPAPQAMQAPRQ